MREVLHETPANDIEFSGERKRVRCNEGLGGVRPMDPEVTRPSEGPHGPLWERNHAVDSAAK